MVKLHWEKLSESEQRAKIIGGWIIAFTSSGVVTASCFVPDHEHKWEDLNEMILAQAEHQHPGISDKTIIRVAVQHSTYDVTVEMSQAEHPILIIPANSVLKTPKPDMLFKELFIKGDEDEDSDRP